MCAVPGARNGAEMLTVLKIDRVSGAFEQIVQFNDKGGLTHMGHCTPATRMF
jgi:hypothetical protein